MKRARPASLAHLLALPVLAAACSDEAGPGAPSPPWFVEDAAARGIRVAWESGATGEHLMPEIMGGGGALFDLEGDGDLDVYLVQSGAIRANPAERPRNRLFENDGSGTFEDVTDGSGAGDQGLGMGVAAADADGDGDVDLYVTNVGPNVMLVNDGEGCFVDRTAASSTGDVGWGTSAAFADLDVDGDLDLYVCNYLHWSEDSELACSNRGGAPDYCDPQAYQAPAADVLYENLGDGRYADRTTAAGVDAPGTGLGVVCADVDDDGLPDVFVANDGRPNFLWRNQGGLRFVDEALARGCAVDLHGAAKAGMGVEAADVDDDGDLDLLVCNLGTESDSFFRNDAGTFLDHTARVGLARVSRPFTRFGVGAFDFDADGWLDLYQANGRVQRLAPRFADDPYAEPNLLFAGRADGTFEEVAPRGGTAEPLVTTSRGAAFGDVDGDGAVDVLVLHRDAPASLLLNRTKGRERTVVLEVVDDRGAPALGATVRARLGDRTLRREVRSAASYLAASAPAVHVGLGDAAALEDVEVSWPDGRTVRVGTIPCGERRVVRPPPP